MPLSDEEREELRMLSNAKYGLLTKAERDQLVELRSRAAVES